MFVRYRLDYIGPKGFLAEWRARRKYHASCKLRINTTGRNGVYAHACVVQIDDESSTCYCGEVGGQYVENRDKGWMMFKKVAWYEYESDIEAATAARDAWEQEDCKQRGGRYEWAWVDVEVEPAVYNAGGEMERARKTKIERFREWKAPDKFTRQPGEEGPLVRKGSEFGTTEYRYPVGNYDGVIERWDDPRTNTTTWRVKTPTNDGLDIITTVVNSREEALALARSVYDPLDSMRYVTPAVGTGSGLGNDTLDNDFMPTRPGTVQPIPVPQTWPGKVERERDTVEMLARIGKRARRDEGEV